MTLLNQAAPEFTLLTTKLEPLKLSELRGKTVVLAFYPAAFSGICDTEMCTFQSNLSRLNDANAVVVGVSPDSPFANAKFKETYNLEFDLLSDLHLEAARAYGVLFENFARVEGYTACNRAVFIIDEGGTITFAWAGEHPGMEPDYEQVLAAI